VSDLFYKRACKNILRTKITRIRSVNAKETVNCQPIVTRKAENSQDDKNERKFLMPRPISTRVNHMQLCCSLIFTLAASVWILSLRENLCLSPM